MAPFFAASPAVALLFFLSPGAFGLHHLSFPILLLFWERCRLGGTPGGGVALPSLRFRAVMSAPEALLDRPYYGGSDLFDPPLQGSESRTVAPTFSCGAFRLGSQATASRALVGASGHFR